MSFDGPRIQRDVMLAQNGVDAILLALEAPHQIEAMLRQQILWALPTLDHPEGIKGREAA